MPSIINHWIIEAIQKEGQHGHSTCLEMAMPMSETPGSGVHVRITYDGTLYGPKKER